jgi:hypothetical protein
MAALPASAEIVVIVSQKNPATRMFSEQASQFFLGKSNLFTPVDQPEARHRNRVLPENRRQGSRSGESPVVETGVHR